MSGAGLPADPAFFMKRLREQGHIHCFASKSFIQREAKWGQGALPLAGSGVEPQTGFGAVAPKTTRGNAVSEQAAQQPTIETGAIREAGIRTRISIGLFANGNSHVLSPVR